MTNSGYIGVTIKPVAKRYYQHLRETRVGSKLRVHAAMRNPNLNMEVETLLEGSEEYCYMMEKKLRPCPDIGLNINAGGDVSPRTGVKLSPETCEKLRRNNLGKTLPASWRLSMSVASKGKPKSPEHCQRISQGHLGKSKSAEHVANMTIAATLHAKSVNGWEWYNADHTTWALAEEIYSFSMKFPAAGSLRAATSHGLKRGHVVSMLRSIKSGWNPSTDEAFQSWLAQHKLKECNESTLAT